MRHRFGRGCRKGTNTRIEPIREIEAASGIDIRAGSVDCFTDEAYENACSAAGIMRVPKAYNPEASWAGFESFAQR